MAFSEALFLELLSKHAGSNSVQMSTAIFGDGLDMTSIQYTEFIMEIEEVTGLEIDIDDLDGVTETAGQLYHHLAQSL